MTASHSVLCVCPFCKKECSVGTELIGGDVSCPHCSVVFPAKAPEKPDSIAAQWRAFGPIGKLMTIIAMLALPVIVVFSIHDIFSNTPWTTPEQTENQNAQSAKHTTDQQASSTAPVAKQTPPPEINATESKQASGNSPEFSDFFHANTLFNQQDYTNALSAYELFIKMYPYSQRIPIVRQRIDDIQRVIIKQIDANKQGIADEFAKAHEIDVQHNFHHGSGVFNYPGTTIVKGYGKTKGEAYKDAKRQVPEGAEEWSMEYYPVSLDKLCCEVSYK